MARRPPETNLPVERGAFVGRERGLLAIAKVLGDDDAAAHVLGLTGPPGIGKTRLALRAAARELPRFGLRGGVWLVECLGVDDARGLVRLIGLMLGLLPEAGASDDVERARVAAALNERGGGLVVIDGVDPVAGAFAAVVELARLVPQARFLVTRRASVEPELLTAGQVTAFTVGALSTVKKSRTEESEAAQLFVERLSEARGTHARALAPDDLTAIGNLVKHLDGVPQAIELAAARCRVLSPAELLERMPRNLQALAPVVGQKSALAGVVAWSLDLLQPWERATLAQTVIFHGGFTAAAARAVVDLSEVANAPSVDAALEGLLEKALLKVASIDDEDLPRYLHPPAVRDLIVAVRPARAKATLKASTLELLPGVFSGEGAADGASTTRIELSTTREALVKRHAAWALARGGALKEAVDGHGGLVARRQLEREQENLLAVVRRALGEETATLTSLTQALMALAALEPVMTTRGPHDLWKKLLDRAVEPAESAGVSPALVAQSLEMRARLLRAQGQLAASQADLTASLSLARRGRDRVLEARALANLGTHCVYVGEHAAARAHYDEAIALMRELGELRLEGRCIGFFGLLDEEADQLDAAAQHYENAIEIHLQTGDRRWEGLHQMQLGRVRLAQGDVDEAHRLLKRALTLHRELWNRRAEAHTLQVLGDVAAVVENAADAVALWGKARAIASDIGDPTLLATLHARLALAARVRGDDNSEDTRAVEAALARVDDPQILAAVATLQGRPMPSQGVHVRSAERVKRAFS